MEFLTSAILGNFDVTGSITGLLEFQRGAKVDQEFQLGLSKIDYKVAREQLHREDIRDLVELTTGRMDMYHVVGTLLLSFCIEWYTSSEIFENTRVDDWFAGLFYISNFSAVAYLIFSVWLAMHAAIASHAIGVRMLTTYTRLHSLPSRREQLERLKIKAMGMPTALQELLDQGKSFLKERGVLDTVEDGWTQAQNFAKADVMPLFGCHDEEEEERRIDPYLGGQAVTRPEMRAQHYEAGHPLGYDECMDYWASLSLANKAVENFAPPPGPAGPSGANSLAVPLPTMSVRGGGVSQMTQPSHSSQPSHASETEASEKDEDEDEEDVETRHFREFYIEQRKWMSYDAHSRLCMSLGMNQLLQALSYYVFGIIMQKARSCAIVSFLAVKMLSLLLLRLDTRDTGAVSFSYTWRQHRCRDIRLELESRRNQGNPDLYSQWYSLVSVFPTRADGDPPPVALPLPLTNLLEDMFPLRVTISSGSNSRRNHFLMFFFFSFLPPAIAAFLLEAYGAGCENCRDGDERRSDPFAWDRLLALVCYFQHGVWLLYLGQKISGIDWFTGRKPIAR